MKGIIGPNTKIVRVALVEGANFLNDQTSISEIIEEGLLRWLRGEMPNLLIEFSDGRMLTIQARSPLEDTDEKLVLDFFKTG